MKSRKGMCVEINGEFYESLGFAGREFICDSSTVKNRCLSNKFPNYKIVPFRVTYTEKKCCTCEKNKPLIEFYLDKTNKDGHRCDCKECGSKHGNGYRKDNPDYSKVSSKKWREDNPECSKVYNREWKAKNPDYQKNYEGQPRVLEKRRKKIKEKRCNDFGFKLNDSMSHAIRTSLKGMKHGKPWEILVGYPLSELVAHLESLFTEGMNWDNYGHGKYKWNIDHVIAKCHFNVTSNT